MLSVVYLFFIAQTPFSLVTKFSEYLTKSSCSTYLSWWRFCFSSHLWFLKLTTLHISYKEFIPFVFTFFYQLIFREGISGTSASLVPYHCAKSVQIRSFSGPCFPIFGLNTEIFSVNLLIQSENWKIRIRKNSILDTFNAVYVIHHLYVIYSRFKTIYKSIQP